MIILYAFHGVLEYKKICKKQYDLAGLLDVNMLRLIRHTPPAGTIAEGLLLLDVTT